MSWEQKAVNAQVNVNRLVWNLNCQYEKDSDFCPEYCIEQAREAIIELNECIKGLTNQYVNKTLF